MVLEELGEARWWRLGIRSLIAPRGSCCGGWGFGCANQKTREGASHPDRVALFLHINETARAALGAQQPVISVEQLSRIRDNSL